MMSSAMLAYDGIRDLKEDGDDLIWLNGIMKTEKEAFGQCNLPHYYLQSNCHHNSSGMLLVYHKKNNKTVETEVGSWTWMKAEKMETRE